MSRKKYMSLGEIVLSLEFHRRMGVNYSDWRNDNADDAADGYVYLVAPITPDHAVHVKVGSTASPLDRIKQFNCSSPDLYRGSFFKVLECEFWEGTVKNIFKDHRVSRYYGLSEIVRGREALNDVETLISKWEPDPEALAWLYHSHRVIAMHAGFNDLAHVFMDHMDAKGLVSTAFLIRALELYHREYDVTTSDNFSPGPDYENDGRLIVYDCK